MSQSNYEKYAVVKQQELLHKERNLQQAISCLRDRKKLLRYKTLTVQQILLLIYIIYLLTKLKEQWMEKNIGASDKVCEYIQERRKNLLSFLNTKKLHINCVT